MNERGCAMSLHADHSALDDLIHTFEGHLAGMDSRTALVVRKSAFEVERRSKILAHVDTGAMRNQITTREVANTGRTYAMTVVAEAAHSGFEEFGTSRRPPHPFMRPAVDAVAPMFVQAMAQLANPLESR